MCSNCQSWENGQMILSSTDTDWVYAWRKGSSLDTTDRDAMIYQHDTFGGFSLDLTKATIASDANPFVAPGPESGDDGSDSGSDATSGGFSVNARNAAFLSGVVMSVLVTFIISHPLG